MFLNSHGWKSLPNLNSSTKVVFSRQMLTSLSDTQHRDVLTFITGLFIFGEVFEQIYLIPKKICVETQPVSTTFASDILEVGGGNGHTQCGCLPCLFSSHNCVNKAGSEMGQGQISLLQLPSGVNSDRLINLLLLLLSREFDYYNGDSDHCS